MTSRASQPARPDLSQLLICKICVPGLAAWQIERPRLIRLVEERGKRSLTTIKAGPGFGKTSLAAAWAERLQQHGTDVAWLSLDPEDDEPSRFLAYFVRALRRANSGIGPTAEQLTAVSPLNAPSVTTTALINDLGALARDLFIFIDDFHLVSKPEILDGLIRLIKYAPPYFHVVLASRSELTLPLATIRSQNQLCEIESASLCFDASEIGAFLKVEGLGELALPELEQLLHSTQGWPAVLRILAVTAHQTGEPFSTVAKKVADTQPIAAYFDELLGGLPRDLVDFMIDTSVVDRLAAPLCDHIVGCECSAVMLRDLDARHLFQPSSDPIGGWRYFHPLLAEHLASTLHARDPAALMQLHARARDWFEQNGFWTDAIKHALACGDRESAARWIDKCAMQLVKSGDLLTLIAWRQQFPQEIILRQLEAALGLAWGLMLAVRLDEALELVEDIERRLEATEATSARLQCDVIRAVVLANKGDTIAALDLAKYCAAESDDPWISNVASNLVRLCCWKHGDLKAFFSVPWIPFPLEEQRRSIVPTTYRAVLQGSVALQQLQTGLAERHCLEATCLAADSTGPLSLLATVPAALLGYLRYYQGRAEEAEALLLPRIPLVNAVVSMDCPRYAYLVLSRLHAHRGQLDAAHARLDEAEQIAHERGSFYLLSHVLVDRAQLYRREGRLLEIEAIVLRLEQIAAAHPAPTPCGWSLIHRDLGTTRAILARARNRPTDAAAIFNALRTEAEAYSNVLQCQWYAVQFSLALFAAGRRAEAVSALRAVAMQAVDVGLPQLILEHGEEVGPLLCHVQNELRFTDEQPDLQGAIGGLVMTWSAAFRKARSASSLAISESLTARERSVLQLIGRGFSNKEIARELSIGPETVKSHVRHIFIKLGVERRTQALVQARLLGLLAPP
jgi:LuxR family transcriptional regulator, maltose regulon positive regulatory protein